MATKPRVLIMDDEPFLLDWLVEFFEYHGYDVEMATTVSEACAAIQKETFKMVIADLQIPAGPELKNSIEGGDSLVQEYPGIYAVQLARDLGHWDDQVIIYSVHMGEAISEKATKLYCTYLPKLRPDVLKETIVASLRRGERREQRRVAARAKKEQTAPKKKPAARSRKKASVPRERNRAESLSDKKLATSNLPRAATRERRTANYLRRRRRPKE